MSDTNYVFLANTSNDVTSYSDGLNPNDEFAVPLTRNRNNVRFNLDDGDNQEMTLMVFKL